MPHIGNQKQKIEYEILDEVGESLGLAFQIMDDVLEASSDTNILGKSNKSDIVNQKLTYISVFGEQSSIEEANALSEACTAKLEDSFNRIDVKDLIELAKFMVSRKN